MSCALHCLGTEATSKRRGIRRESIIDCRLYGDTTVRKSRRSGRAIVLSSVSLILAAAYLSRYVVAENLSWVFSTFNLPSGLRGLNNCTFAFGQDIPQWDFHPDAGCWEHPGPDGWVRQQQYNIHIPSAAACGGGPGDATNIRICRRDDDGLPVFGYPAPCGDRPTPEFPTTGPNGCSICYRSLVCHTGEEYTLFMEKIEYL